MAEKILERTTSQENRKTRYTKQVIREVFIQLLQEQPLEKVTVTRICELADISRGTFYLHYNDPYDLLAIMENEFLADLKQQLLEKTVAATIDYSKNPLFWLDILKWLSADKKLAQLFFANPNSTFMTKCLALNRAFSDNLCKLQYPEKTQTERDYMHTFYEHGSASVIGQWVKNGFQEPPEQIAEYLTSLNMKGC